MKQSFKILGMNIDTLVDGRIKQTLHIKDWWMSQMQSSELFTPKLDFPPLQGRSEQLDSIPDCVLQYYAFFAQDIEGSGVHNGNTIS